MKNPGKTRRRLLIIGLSASLLIAAAAGVYAVRKQRIRAQYMAWRDEGMKAAKAGDNEKSVDLLGRYLRRYSTDVPVLIEYSRIRPLVKEPNRQHLRDTMLVLRSLLSTCPDLPEQRRQLAKLYDEYGYAAEALASADQLLKIAPNDPEIVGIRVSSLARMRRLPEALAAAREWTRLAPAELDPHMFCLELIRASELPKSETDKAVNLASEQLKDQASLDLVRAFAAASSGSMKEAVKFLESAGNREIPDAKVRKRLLRSLEGLGLYEKSLVVLKRFVKEFEDPEDRRVLVQRLWELSNWPEVITYAKAIDAQALASDRMLQGMIGFAMLRTGATVEAEKISAVLKADKSDALAQAWAILLDSENSTAPVDAKSRINIGENALKENPSDPYVRFFVGEAYNVLGESELAMASYQRAAQSSQTWALPLLRMSEMLLASGKLERAFDTAQVAFQRSSGQSVWTYARVWNANIQAGRRDDEAEFEGLLAEVRLKVSDDTLLIPEQVSALARSKKAGKLDEARKLIRDALALGAKIDATTLSRLAAASRLYSLGLEAECYGEIEKKQGSSPGEAVSRAIFELAGGHRENVLAKFDASRQRSGSPVSVAWQVAHAQVLDALHDPSARQAWIAVGDAHAEDSQVQLAVLSARSAQLDRSFTDRTIDRVKSLTGTQGVQWRIARARWQLEGSNDAQTAEKASVLLNEALSTAPESAEARFLQARALERMGNTAAATEQMSMLVRSNPTMNSALLYLSQLLQAQGDVTKAREYVQRAVGGGLADANQKRWAAQLFAQQGDPLQAIKLLKDTELGEGGALMLATFYRQSGNIAPAEEMCRKMLENPSEAAIEFAADFYCSIGRPEDAKKAIDLIKEIHAQPGFEELLMADFSVRNGAGAEAVSYARRATQKATGRLAPRAWKALVVTHVSTGKLLDAQSALIEGTRALPEDAYLQAARNVFPKLQQSWSNPLLHDLSVALLQNPQTAGTKELIEAVVELQSRHESQNGQLAQFRQLADRYSQNLPVQLFVANMLLGAQHLDDAIAITTRAAQSFPTSVEATRLAAGALFTAGRWEETLAFARAWHDRTGGNSKEADYLAARSFIKLKQFEAAQQQLSPHITAAKADPDHNAEVIAAYCASLQLSGKRAESEQMLLPLLQKSENTRIAWLQIATESFSNKDAIEWTGRIADMAGESSLGANFELINVASDLGRKGGGEKLRTVARKLRASLAVRKDLTATALAVLASQAELDDDLTEAQALYRRALSIDPALPVANNNLAMVLAKTGGDLAEAQTLIKTAIRSAPNVPNFHDTLANILERRGDSQSIDEAVQSLKSAVQLDPDSTLWLGNLVELLFKAGRKEEAAKAFLDLKALSTRVKLDDESKSRVERIRRLIATTNVRAAVTVLP